MCRAPSTGSSRNAPRPAVRRSRATSRTSWSVRWHGLLRERSSSEWPVGHPFDSAALPLSSSEKSARIGRPPEAGRRRCLCPRRVSASNRTGGSCRRRGRGRRQRAPYTRALRRGGCGRPSPGPLGPPDRRTTRPRCARGLPGPSPHDPRPSSLAASNPCLAPESLRIRRGIRGPRGSDPRPGPDRRWGLGASRPEAHGCRACRARARLTARPTRPPNDYSRALHFRCEQPRASSDRHRYGGVRGPST